ncbi:MAG: sugar transporter, partial [Bacteroidetes bacterium]|nr:sugar transporter [Bacteroidota bacterium]
MKKLTIILVAFFALMMPFASVAQIYDPVQWSFSTESLGNNEYNVIFKAQIEAGWH